MGPRYLIEEFSAIMDDKMWANDDKPGWHDADPRDLLLELQGEVAELIDAVTDNECPDAIALEAADVANYAMMIADRMGGIPHDDSVDWRGRREVAS